MILHCSKKLAAKLLSVSAVPLEESSPLGCWHGHLFVLDHRQCVMFIHDETRYVLFLPGLRKAQFAVLDKRWFQPLFLASLAFLGCPDGAVKKAELALGAVQFDTATDRSVMGSLKIVRLDLDGWLYRVPNVMDLDHLLVSRDLNQRPTTVYGKSIWPQKAMYERVMRL
jgi:Domain of unknown function (DUF6933)